MNPAERRHCGRCRDLCGSDPSYDRRRKRRCLARSVEIAEPQRLAGHRCAAIDPGVRIRASVSIEGFAQARYVENRVAMKDWDFLGREIARKQQAIAGTRGAEKENHAPTSRHIARLHQLRRLRLEHAMQTMAKMIARHCVGSGVSKVSIGWPKNILRGVTYGVSIWSRRSQKFWSFGRGSSGMQHALEAVGIQSERVSERGSSSTCCDGGSKQVMRKPRWLIRCNDCRQTLQAEQSGGRTILKAQTPGLCWAGAEAAPLTETRRWTRQCWALRSANPRQQVGIDLPEFLNAAS